MGVRLVVQIQEGRHPKYLGAILVFPPQRGEKVICRALFFFFFFDDHVFLFIKGFLKKIHDRLREFLVNGLKQNLIRPRIRYIKKHPASHEVGWKAPLASLSCLADNLLPVPIQG